MSIGENTAEVAAVIEEFTENYPDTGESYDELAAEASGVMEQFEAAFVALRGLHNSVSEKTTAVARSKQAAAEQAGAHIRQLTEGSSRQDVQDMTEGLVWAQDSAEREILHGAATSKTLYTSEELVKREIRRMQEVVKRIGHGQSNNESGQNARHKVQEAAERYIHGQ